MASLGSKTKRIQRKQIDKLLNVIRTWIETESGPTKMTFTHPELQVQVKIRGYKKIILERKFHG